MCTILLTGGCNKNQSDKDQPEEVKADMLRIKSLHISDTRLNLEYEIKNTLPHDIWVCDDIHAYYDLRVETKVEEEQLLIKLRSFDVPHGILLESPILAKYRRVKPNEIYKSSIGLILPIRSESPISEKHSDRDAKITKEIRRIVLEIGFYEEGLFTKVSDSVERSDSDDVVYIGHLWEERNKEKITKVSITGIVVLCCM